MGRTFVIGDIHGGLRALHQVLARADIKRNDKLIFLGDYVDAWSESPQVLDFLIELDQSHDCLFIRGNHDDLLMEWLGGKENKLWYQHGGEATILSYLHLSETVRNRHIEFLKRLTDYYIDKKNRLFLHAGFTNLNGVGYEYYPRLFFWDRTLWETALALDQRISPDDPSYPKRFSNYHEIYIGHTPVTRIGQTIPVCRANVWNLDTGAAFRGPLTIMDIETKQFWQSDPLPELYPEERGRN